ncbi:MAG: hypothetical protein WBW98_13635 [Candidatus Sulfotelmatobacter sp.]|jgi:hypothetical protein
MKDVYDVLRQKEADTERVRREIRALLQVIPMLVDERQLPEEVVNEKGPDPVVQRTILLGDQLPNVGAYAPTLQRPRIEGS